MNKEDFITKLKSITQNYENDVYDDKTKQYILWFMKKLIHSRKVLIRLRITSLTPHHFGGLTYCRKIIYYIDELLWLCER